MNSNGSSHSCLSSMDDCINDASYGVICVLCNCCGRFDPTTKLIAQEKYYSDTLKKEEEQLKKVDANCYKADIIKQNIETYRDDLKQVQDLIEKEKKNEESI